MPSFCIGLDHIHQAAERIRSYVIRTPSLHCESLSRELDCRVAFKAENLQYVGAFKARGAMNAIMGLDEDDAKAGVVTHSSGNHAQAIARAASIRGIQAHIVMPENSSPLKIAAVQSYGVQPQLCKPSAAERAAAAESLRQETGATLIHPFDTPQVIAGQGTVGLEILDQFENVDSILVPIGGGGLLSGVLMAVKSLRPEVSVFAVEPEFADDASRSLKSGTRQMPTRYDTIADGLRTEVGENTFPIIKEMVDDLFLVSEQAIQFSMRRLAEDAHLVSEPSGAVALAGLFHNQEQFVGKNVAVVVSGGNLDFGSCALGR